MPVVLSTYYLYKNSTEYITSDALKIVPNTVVKITEVGTIFNASDVIWDLQKNCVRNSKLIQTIKKPINFF
jgi:hypothetical protein